MSPTCQTVLSFCSSKFARHSGMHMHACMRPLGSLIYSLWRSHPQSKLTSARSKKTDSVTHPKEKVLKEDDVIAFDCNGHHHAVGRLQYAGHPICNSGGEPFLSKKLLARLTLNHKTCQLSASGSRGCSNQSCLSHPRLYCSQLCRVYFKQSQLDAACC